ncbi:hypothetical protein MRX96_033121 [Rhipicephalus microplus]
MADSVPSPVALLGMTRFAPWPHEQGGASAPISHSHPTAQDLSSPPGFAGGESPVVCCGALKPPSRRIQTNHRALAHAITGVLAY